MSDEKAEKSRKLPLTHLRLVIDPETRADVVRLRLLEDSVAPEQLTILINQ